MALAVPECHLDAEQLLRRWKVPLGKVIAVDVDSILFLDPLQRPQTAWLRQRPGISSAFVRIEPGFCAERTVLFADEFAVED